MVPCQKNKIELPDSGELIGYDSKSSIKVYTFLSNQNDKFDKINAYMYGRDNELKYTNTFIIEHGTYYKNFRILDSGMVLFDGYLNENQNNTAELQMSEPQEDTVEDINEILENVIMEPISISEEISEESEDEKKLRTKIADLILNIVGRIKTAVGNLIRIVQNFLGIPKRILKKMQSLALTIRNFCDKINWWKEFLDHPRTREALSFLCKNAKKLIYHVLPTRITGKITFGNEDPAVTGMVLAVLGMTIPFHKNKIEAAPLFDDENVLEGEIMLKGRIYGIVVLTTAAKLYFNKNIKYVIHRWRHKEVKHGERE